MTTNERRNEATYLNLIQQFSRTYTTAPYGSFIYVPGCDGYLASEIRKDIAEARAAVRKDKIARRNV